MTVRLALAGGASVRASAPVRCAVAARMQPPWRHDDHVLAAQLVGRRRHAGLELLPRLAPGSARRRCQAATDSGSSSSTVKPAHGPMSISRQRSSVGAPASPSSSAVCTRAREVGGEPRVGDAVEEGRERLGLLAPELGQRRVGLALQAMLGVPGRLAVADEQQAVDHGDSVSNSCVRTRLRRGGQVERGAPPSARSRGSAAQPRAPLARADPDRAVPRRLRAARRDRRDQQHPAPAREPVHERREHPLRGPCAQPCQTVAPVGLPRVGHRAQRREVEDAAGQVAVQRRHLLGLGGDDEVARAERGRDVPATVRTLLLAGGGPETSHTANTPASATHVQRAPRDSTAASAEQQRAEQDREVARRPRRLELRAEEGASAAVTPSSASSPAPSGVGPRRRAAKAASPSSGAAT